MSLMDLELFATVDVDLNDAIRASYVMTEAEESSGRTRKPLIRRQVARALASGAEHDVGRSAPSHLGAQVPSSCLSYHQPVAMAQASGPNFDSRLWLALLSLSSLDQAFSTPRRVVAATTASTNFGYAQSHSLALCDW